jgi:acetyl-CoA carboxylase carboxyl transferase subunit alpha
LLDLEVIDEIIREPIGGAHRNVDETCNLIKNCLIRITEEFENMTPEEIILHREKKYLEIGNKFLEN